MGFGEGLFGRTGHWGCMVHDDGTQRPALRFGIYLRILLMYVWGDDQMDEVWTEQ